MGGPRAQESDRRRRAFYAALGLFLAWVVVLGVMATVSGRRPAPNPAAVEER